MNKDINLLYEQYKSLGNPETFDEFVQLKDQAGEDMFFEFMNNYVSDSLKKKENSQETPSSSSGLGENQPTPISAQGNPQVTSVPISQDLDLNQAQIEAMQGVQNPASLNLELPQQSVNQNGLLESNGEVNTSSSVLEDSFNNFIQEGGQLSLNPTSTRLNVLPRAYEEQFNNVTESTPQVSVTENINTTNNDFVDFGNGITLPKELLPEEKTKEEFNKEIAESAKDVTLKQSGKLEPFDIENPKWINKNIGDLQGENYVNAILEKEKEGKVKVARNEKGELIDKDLKPILDNSNVLWQPIGSYINDYNNDVNKFNKEIELNNQKISKNNALIESQNIRDLFLGKKEEPKSPLTTLYNKIYSDTGILLTDEQKAQFNTIDDVYNFYASEKAKKEVQKNPKLNYNEEYNKLINELNPKIDAQQSLQLGKNFVNNFLLGFRIEEEKSFNEARGYGAKIDTSYQKGYNSKDDLQEINFIKNLSNNQYGLGLIGEWWNAVGKKEIGTTNYKINATLSTPEGRADVINSIANYINGRGSIQKELAYENIQREKFNNLKNAKEGNALALQNSINFIQSESNKINQIDKQQKEIYDFIDSWKKTQIRNNKKEQEFARTYSGYQSGEILPSIKIIAGNTVNGISDAVKSTIAGVAQLPNLAIGSDEYNDVISEIKKPSEFFGVKTSGMFSKYYDYKSGGKDIRFQNGNYYELVNGDYRPINLTYAQISNLGKAKEGEEFSIAGMIGDTTRMATEIGLSEFTGAVSLKALSKFSQLRNIEMVSSVFGEESALTNSLQRLERFSKNPTNNGYFGWFTQTIADNYQEAKAKGMTNTQASVYGSVQSLLTSFLSRINPDVKFFKTYKEIDEKLIGSLLKNDKQGFLNNLKSLSNHVGGEISSETGQELTEQFAQELVKQFYNTSLTDKKFDTMTADDVLKTVITTAITTGALTSSNLALRGSGDNIVNYDNAYYNSTQLSEGQKLVMLANLNTSEIFKNFNNQFISDKNKLNEIEQTVKSVKMYLDKVPNKDKYTINTQTKAVSLLYEIDQKRKQLNNVDESFKDDINNEINGLTDELKQLLNDDLKLQNEQPQQTTQPEQTQETAQGQTTETTLQPEQGTTTTEQSVSTDVDSKNITNFEPNMDGLNIVSNGKYDKSEYYFIKNDKGENVGEFLIEKDNDGNGIITGFKNLSSKKGFGLDVFKIATNKIIQLGLNPKIDNNISGYGYDALKKLSEDGYLQFNGIEKIKSNSQSTDSYYEVPPFSYLKQKLTTNETKQTTQPEQTTVAGEQGVSADVESQKADIERRRQEELKKFPTTVRLKKNNVNGENTELTERQIGSVEKAISKSISDGKSAEETIAILNALGFVPLAGNETTALLNYIKDRIEGKEIRPYNEIHGQLLDKINAKYDAELKELENNNQNIQYNGKENTRTTVQEQGSGEKMLGNEQRSQENGQNTDLGLSSMGEQNQEQRQTTQQVKEVATNITEEEQEKINLERLYAYIEAKKQREQEQQVQVSQSEEAISNKEESKITKDSIRQSLDEFEIFSNSRNLAKYEIIKILELIPKDLRDNPLENGFYKDAGVTEDFIKSNKKEDFFKELNDSFINNSKNSIIAEFYTKAKVDGSNPELVKAVEDLLGNVQQNEAFSVNEQPQNIEQPSETQTTPLVSESKSTNGKYTIIVEQKNGIGTAKILDNNGNEVKLSNKQKEKYVAEHFVKQSYPETVVEDADKLNPSEFNQELVKTSNNPIELAQILDTESEFITSDLLDAKENAIANVIGNKVSRSSFIQFDDANNISFSIARGYGLTNKGKTIDVIAQEAEVLIYGDWDSQNPRVTTEDVINFMKKYNNGADTFFRQPNPTYRDAAGKFEKITGIKATKNALDVLLGKKTATKIDFAKLQEEADALSAEQAYNLEKEYNEWFNSLSLEDKNLELQKTYPYEQRTEEDTSQSQNESVSNNQTESSENVANQERDGATTEEINQVSPSTQYEGAVTYTQFGEGQEGTLYYDEGVAKIKDKAGKVYNANSPLVKNLKDAEGNAIQLQKGNQRLTPITKQAFDALVTKLQKAFPRFAKVTYDFEAFKKQAEKLGATFNDIQRMVMAFHGSPHSFDKFSTEFMGTGEGQQAFGWGLYFTELKGVAEYYAKITSKNSQFAYDKLKHLELSKEEIDKYMDNPYIKSAINNIKKKRHQDLIKEDLYYAYKRYNEKDHWDYKNAKEAVDFFDNHRIGFIAKNGDLRESDINGDLDLFIGKTNKRNLYQVQLHQGKTPEQYSWMLWDKPLSENQIDKVLSNENILRVLREYSPNGAWTKEEVKNELIERKVTGENLYKSLTRNLTFSDTNNTVKQATPKDVSLELLKSGIDGIKMPVGAFRNGTTSDNARGFNYVVFDDQAVTIVDKVQFMQTPNGTIYGAKLPDGTIYLNPEFLNANTPIHEFSHLFEQLLPSRFKKGVELLKQTNLGKKLFEQLKQEGNYANLTDEQLWSEALNTHIGNFGENEVNNTKGKLKQLQDWIKDFFAKVGDVLGIKKLSPDTQLRMFTEGVVKDLLGGKPIVAENQVSPSEQVQYSFLTENDYDTNGNIKPEVLAEIQAEREAIKSEAQANGTFMKAPNGNATNLNEAQWIDVRTKRFKDWFGDWENDAKNASKVVDENGEPLVVYHGSSKDFTEFDNKKSRFSGGIYFSSLKEFAQKFAGNNGIVKPFFLNIKNPVYNGFDGAGVGAEMSFEYRDGGIFTKRQTDKYAKKGTKEYIVGSPNQIKSATENVGTYSASSNDIRYSVNSTTPLSVKEQTEVINELVSNGEESAFAKLQETNWYKGLSNSQKQNINPTNIAETVINAVNANKRNLEQKVERRDAKIEKLQDKNKSELEKQKKYYVDKINDIKQKYKEALIELNLKNKTAVEKVKERLDLRKSAINQIKQLLSDKEVGKNVTPSEVMSLVRMSELFFNARDLDKAFDKFIIRFEKVFDKAQYRNKSAEEKFNDKLSKVNPLTADEKASYRREKKSLKERMLIFKNKWFANQGGIIKPFLEHRDRATGLANWEKRVAKNTVEQLTDEANKIGFNTESNWEIFNNALQGDKTAIGRLPETIKPYVTMMRSQIDGLSLELIKNDLVTKEQALAIEENLGKYITRGYSIFEGDTTIEKVGKKFFRMIFKKENSIASRFDSEKWADAVTVFQQNVLNEIALDSSDKYAKYDTDEKKQSFARREGERRLLEYLSELESEYKKAGSGVGADTSVLERRKEIAEPIRRLLGEYIDPRMSFLLTVSRVSDLAYQRKFLSQVKEIGLGTFLFEEGDPNIPIEGYVKIASDTNGAYSPLNGLYTTKEFKDVFLGEPQKEKYEIEKLWLKLTGLVKVGKTVFSPLTQAVNFNANFGFLINNGLIMDVKQISPAFKAFSDTISNGRLDNYIVRELIEENILGQSLIFNEVEKDFGINMEKELIKSIRQTTVAKTAKEIVDIPFRLYKASDDFFKAFAYFSEADRYAKAYFGKKYEELTGDDRMKIRKIASEVVKNTMPNYDRVYKAANLPKEFTRNAVGNYLSFQAESIRTKINSIQYAIADLKNEKTRAVGAKRLAGIMTYNAIYGTVTTLVGKAAGMGMAGLLGFFDDEDEDEKRANFNLTVPEWARSVEKYYRREKDGTITWFAYGNANPYGIWYKTANAYFNGSSNSKGGLISVFDELLTPFLGTEMSLKWISNTFIAEKNDYGVSLVTPKDKLNYSIEKLSPSIVKLIKDNTDNKKENDFELVNILGIKKYNFNPTDQLRYKYNDYAALMSDLGSKKYTLEKQVESGKKKPEEVMDEWKDYDDKQKEYADEFRELAKAYISLGADPTFIQGKATKKFKYEINSISDWWDYITRPE